MYVHCYRGLQECRDILESEEIEFLTYMLKDNIYVMNSKDKNRE